MVNVWAWLARRVSPVVNWVLQVHPAITLAEPVNDTAGGLSVECLAELLRLDAFTAKLMASVDSRPPLLGLATSCKQLLQLVSHLNERGRTQLCSLAGISDC
jgi:hypothetical protein